MKLKNLTKVYHNRNNDVQALNNINLSFSQSGLTFIVGESGCGKTTLLNIIAGHDKEYDGEIENDGRVESIEQEIMLMENLSVFDNLLMVNPNQHEVISLLEHFNLIPEKDKKVKKLSGGEKKRVQIIRSLLTKASYLVCDEPTASLDFENKEIVMQILKETSKEIGVIIVTHDISIVDKYADRIIQMGKGKIISEQPIINKDHHIDDSKETRGLLTHLKLLIKMTISRWQETLFHFGLIFVLTLILFVAVFLFPSLNENINAQAIWLNTKNIIITQPIGGNLDLASPERFMDYDLYHKEDAFLAKDNISGIIGYQTGWNVYKFSISSFEEYSNSFLPYVDYETFKGIIEPYKDEYEKYGKIPFPQYPYCLEQIDEIETNHIEDLQYYYFYDFNNFKGLKINGYTPAFSWRADSIPSIHEVYVGGDTHHMDVISYQLFDDVTLELIGGQMPVKENDILLSKSVAKHLARIEGLEEITELIGREIILNIKADLDGEHILPLTVSGITFMESKYENQVFFREGVYDNILAKICDFDPDIVTYQYLNFLTDPKKNVDDICLQLERVLNSKLNHFESYNVSATADMEQYQKPAAISIYVIFSLLTIMTLFIIMNIIINKRTIKENEILKRYSYHPFAMQMTKSAFIFIMVFVIQVVSLSYICEGLNQLANSVGIANVVQYNVIYYTLSVLISCCIVAVLEGVIYAIRTKKHS